MDEAHAPPAQPTPAPRTGHRAADPKDTLAELTARAHQIREEAGGRVAVAMKDVIAAATGMAGFAIESARDLLQFLVRRGQMSQEEADRIVREAEHAHGRRSPEERGKPTASKMAAERHAKVRAETIAATQAANAAARAQSLATKAANAANAAKAAAVATKPAVAKPAAKSAPAKPPAKAKPAKHTSSKPRKAAAKKSAAKSPARASRPGAKKAKPSRAAAPSRSKPSRTPARKSAPSKAGKKTARKR